MNEFLITFRSMTQAQGGQRVLQYKGIANVLRRTPKSVADRGCGYSLSVNGQQTLQSAIRELRARGVFYSKIFRETENGEPEEVVL